MKLIEYIHQLHTLLCKCGDIDVKYCTSYELENREYHETYNEPFKPYYNKNGHCIVVHEDFVRFDD